MLDTTYTLFVVRGPLETPTLILKTARRPQATMHGLAVALAGLPEVEVRLAHEAIVSRVAVQQGALTETAVDAWTHPCPGCQRFQARSEREAADGLLCVECTTREATGGCI